MKRVIMIGLLWIFGVSLGTAYADILIIAHKDVSETRVSRI